MTKWAETALLHPFTPSIKANSSIDAMLIGFHSGNNSARLGDKVLVAASLADSGCQKRRTHNAHTHSDTNVSRNKVDFFECDTSWIVCGPEINRKHII